MNALLGAAGCLGGAAVLLGTSSVRDLIRARARSLPPAAGRGESPGPGGAATQVPTSPNSADRGRSSASRPRSRLPHRAGTLAGLTTGMTAAVALGGRDSAPVGLLIGVAAGAVVGVVVAILAGALVAWFPTWQPAVVARRQAARHDARLVVRLPVGLDLIAASLEAGAPPARALALVGEAIGGPIGDELGIVAHSLWLGASPSEACRRLLSERGAGVNPALLAVARALGRADESGSRLATSFRAIADAQRADAHSRAIENARRVGVYAVAPLGLCFLPAFILVGVTPIVAGVVTQLTR